MLRYYRKHFVLVALALTFSIISQLLTPISAIMEQKMIDLIVKGDMQGFLGFLWIAGAIVMGMALCALISGISERFFNAAFGESLRNDLYDGIMQRSTVRFGEKDTAQYTSYVTNNVNMLVQNLSKSTLYLVSYGVTAFVVLGIMIYYSPILAAASLICGVLSMLPPLKFNKRFSRQTVERVEITAVMSMHLKEALNGHEVISSLGVLPAVRKRFASANAEVAKSDRKVGITIAGIENIGSVLDKAAWFINFFIAGSMAVRGDITVGTLVMFISLFGYFSGCMTMYAQLLPLLLGNKDTIKLTLGLVDGKNTEFSGVKDASLEKGISVKDLSFSYKQDIPVLQGVDFSLKKSEKVALIGPSGCGKSTLIKLLTGNYSGYTGEIRYDGTELRDISPGNLRKLATVIHQNTFIFNDTIRFNICLGEEFSEDALQKALSLSGVDRFLPSISGGLDGSCGENGSHLSGGQRQRIALARALIRGVNLLILDEGVSAIDVSTANEIESELLAMPELTLLTVTHRIKDGLIDRYDRLIAMNDGVLVDNTAAIANRELPA